MPEVPEWLDEYASPLVERVAAIRRDILRLAQESKWIIDEAQLTDQAIIRRMVLKRCIYGVDKIPLTVELPKGSLWLHSFTVGAPLSFLDHHLRCARLADRPPSRRRYRRPWPLGKDVCRQCDPGSRIRDRRYATNRVDIGRRRFRGAGVRAAVPWC